MSASLRSRPATLTLGLVTLLCLASFLCAQQLAKRLILKDGSYQLATKYEVKGDRVRYYSAERGDWEELPKELVDWPATDKFEKDRATGAPPPEAVAIDKEAEAERKAEEAKMPQVAPGLRLPDDEGVFLLDTFQGQPQLNEIQQTGGELNKNMKGNILRAAINPIASSKQTIELEGPHAKIQSHIPQPTLFVNSSDDTSASAEQVPKTGSQPLDPLRFRIARMQTKNDKRIAGNIKIAVYGKVSQQQNLIPTHSEQIPGSNWVKITPGAALQPGEYAVVEMLGNEGMNVYVWDFGVNPSALANVSAWKPDPSAAQPKPTEPSELQNRKPK
jgi:hypothetical protein